MYVLYCIVLCCIVLYCIVLCWIVLYCFVLYCIVLYCVVLCCIVLCCIALYCIASHRFALHCIALYCIVLCCLASRQSYFISFYLIKPLTEWVSLPSTSIIHLELFAQGAQKTSSVNAGGLRELARCFQLASALPQPVGNIYKVISPLKNGDLIGDFT